MQVSSHKTLKTNIEPIHKLVSLKNRSFCIDSGFIGSYLKEASFSRYQSYCQQHRKMVDAIIDSDAVIAERMMRTHLEAVQKNLLGNL